MLYLVMRRINFLGKASKQSDKLKRSDALELEKIRNEVT